MPWKETNLYEERMKFITTWLNDDWTITDLCREFGISRVTGYKYINQYEEHGLDGLKDQSRAPKNSPNAIGNDLIRLIVNARYKHQYWGAEKLLSSLQGRFPKIKYWPSVSTVGRVLRRKGMVKKRRRYNRITKTMPFSQVIAPNDLWCVDYKGHFTVGDGMRCDPLTVTDAHSRFLLACKIVEKTDTNTAKKIFTSLFRKYGMPLAIRSDNGPPFASNTIAGLSPLSVWWLKLGIKLERIEPGKPQQNGRHERMHWTLKQQTALPPRASLKAQQRAFDKFRNEYNFKRPHAALDNKCPAQIYKPSGKKFPEKIPEISYATNIEVYEVSDMGMIRYEMHRVFISSSLCGEKIGLEEIDDRHARIHFCSSIIGVLDTYNGKVLQYKNPMPKELLDPI